jgi:DNA-binding NarL/FixJ family response regulator
LAAAWSRAVNTIQVPLPRVLIMQTDKASREEVAGMLSRYGYSIVGPFAKWSEASGSIRSDAIEAAVVDWSGRDEEGLMAARRLVVLAIPLVFYAAPQGLTERPADLRQIPFLLKSDQAGLILKRLSTALNERLVRQWQPVG